MLNTICSEDFARHIGKSCQVSCQDSPKFDLVIDSVEAKSHLKRPQDQRIPFSVLLKGSLQPSFSFGYLDIEIAGEPFLNGVYISRIAPPWGLDPDSAYYQIIFN